MLNVSDSLLSSIGPENLYFHVILNDTDQGNDFKNYLCGSWGGWLCGQVQRPEFRSPIPYIIDDSQNPSEEMGVETERFLEAHEHLMLSSVCAFTDTGLSKG